MSWFIEAQSPSKLKQKLTENECSETLVLSHFHPSPRLDFGTCLLGKTVERTLYFKNPTEHAQWVVLERFPSQSGFDVASRQFEVAAHSDYPLVISWSPAEPLGIRELIIVKVDQSFKLTAYFLGQCSEITKTPKKKRPINQRKPFAVLQTNHQHQDKLSNLNNKQVSELKNSPLKDNVSSRLCQTKDVCINDSVCNYISTPRSKKVPRRRSVTKTLSVSSDQTLHSPVVSGIKPASVGSPLKDSSHSILNNISTNRVTTFNNISLSPSIKVSHSSKSNEPSIDQLSPSVYKIKQAGRENILVSPVNPEHKNKVFITPESVSTPRRTTYCKHSPTVNSPNKIPNTPSHVKTQSPEKNVSPIRQSQFFPRCLNLDTDTVTPPIVGTSNSVTAKLKPRPTPLELDDVEITPVTKSSVPIFSKNQLCKSLKDDLKVDSIGSGVTFRESAQKINNDLSVNLVARDSFSHTQNLFYSNSMTTDSLSVDLVDSPSSALGSISTKSSNSYSKSSLSSTIEVFSSSYSNTPKIDQFSPNCYKIKQATHTNCSFSPLHTKQKNGVFITPELVSTPRRTTYCKQSPTVNSPNKIPHTPSHIETVCDEKESHLKQNLFFPRRLDLDEVDLTPPVDSLSKLNSKPRPTPLELYDVEITPVSSVSVPPFVKNQLCKSVKTNLQSTNRSDSDNIDMVSSPYTVSKDEDSSTNPTINSISVLSESADLTEDNVFEDSLAILDTCTVASHVENSQNKHNDSITSLLTNYTSLENECTNFTLEMNNSVIGPTINLQKTSFNTSNTMSYGINKHTALTTASSITKPENKTECFISDYKLDQEENSFPNKCSNPLSFNLPASAHISSTANQYISSNSKQQQYIVSSKYTNSSQNLSSCSISPHSEVKFSADGLANINLKVNSLTVSKSHKFSKCDTVSEIGSKPPSVLENGQCEILCTVSQNQSKLKYQTNIALSNRCSTSTNVSTHSFSTSDCFAFKTSSGRLFASETKRTHSPVDSEKINKPSVTQENAKKKLKFNENNVPKPLVYNSLTRTQILRRKAAVGDRSQPVKINQKKPKVAQSHLKLIKNSSKTSALPKHPLPFAAKNMYYDERWIEKQERGFARWVNHILTPPDEHLVSEKNLKFLSLSNEPITKTTRTDTLAPSREVLSLRAYTAQRRLNKLRMTACRLFESDSLITVIKKVEKEVECSLISVRSDRKLYADVGLRKRLFDMIVSFNPLWLRIGLETIYGEILPLSSNNDMHGLSRFLMTRFLANPDIAQQFKHAKVPHLFNPGYDSAISKFILKRFLVLVLFLDKAKSTRLIKHDPCLFVHTSQFKSTKELLIAFSKEFLSGEGDITRHLRFMGFTVSHVQKPLDEFDFSVKNLAVDLKDGIRLVRIVELLTSDWSLSENLRVPAISRLQKIHNVKLGFSALSKCGLQIDANTIHGGPIDARDITDGHHEKTLHLLWSLVFNFQITVLLDSEQLKDELTFLYRYHSIHHRLCSSLALLDSSAASIASPSKGQTLSAQYLKTELLTLLMKWVRVVCHFYDLTVENFTVSFSDGRVFCYLIHHYYPQLLPVDLIHCETTQSNSNGFADVSLDNSISLDDQSFSDTNLQSCSLRPSVYSRLLENEKANFKLLSEKVDELGGVPMMLHSNDMTATIPDEKVVITYLTYLCVRILDLKDESRAARIIQLYWRKYFSRKRRADYLKKERAAKIIQNFYIQYKKLKMDKVDVYARKIQRCWKKHKFTHSVQSLITKRKEVQYTLIKKTNASVILQAYCRGYLVRRSLTTKQAAAAKIQYRFRLFLVKKRVLDNQIAAAIIIQRAVRRHLFNLKKIKSASLIKKWFQKRIEQKKEKALLEATVKIQRWYRSVLTAFKIRSQYLKLRFAIICLQRKYRQKRELLAATKIQATIKMFLQKKHFITKKNAVLTLQTCYRRYSKRQKYIFRFVASLKIQATYRMYRERCEYIKKLNSVLVIQSFTRMCIARKNYLTVAAAARSIIAWWKQIKAYRAIRCEFLVKRTAAITIQKAYRLYKADSAKLILSSVKIQKWYRSVRLQQVISKKIENRKKEKAATTIQISFRSFQSNKRNRAALVIQKAYLTFQLKKLYLDSATIIQRAYRKYRQRKTLCLAAEKIQRFYRKYLFLRQREVAAVNIQNAYKNYLFIKQRNTAATVIQRSYRQYISKKHRNRAATILQQFYRQYSFNKHRNRAAITIQRSFRNYSFTKNRNTAANTIQRSFRQYIFDKRRSRAAVIVQQSYRHYLFNKQRNKAAIKIQRLYKNYSINKKRNAAANVIQKFYKNHAILKQQNISATTIQRFYRQHLFSKQRNIAADTIQRSYRLFYFRKQRVLASVVIQKSYRTHLSFKHNAAAVVIQRAYRRFSVLKQRREAAYIIQKSFRQYSFIKRCNKSATIIQKTYRQYQLHKQRNVAAIIIQTFFRKCIFIKRRIIASMKIQSFYRNYIFHKQRNTSATKIQRLYRTYFFLKQRTEAAIVIQNCFRKYLEYTQCNKAATIIQRCFRQQFLRRKQNKAASLIQYHYRLYSYLKIRNNAATKIQNYFRKYIHRRQQDHASKIIQKFYRHHYWMTQRVTAAKIIQRYIRSLIIRKRFKLVQHSVLVIQTHFYGHLRRKCARQRFKSIKSSVILLQSYLRGYLARSRFKSKCQAAIKLQRFWRKSQFRRNMNAALVIQSACRKWMIYKRYQKIHQATLKIQTYWRSFKTASKFRRNYLLQKSACIKIQSAIRCWISRSHYQKLYSSTLILQQRWRSKLLSTHLQAEYQSKRAACILFQRLFRGSIQRRNYMKLRQSAIIIQTRFKIRQNQLEIKKRSALVLQKHWRGFYQRRLYMDLRQKTICLQRFIRRNYARKQLVLRHNATITIQKSWRSYSTKKAFITQLNAAILIQRFFKCYLSRVKAQAAQIKENNAAIVIQSAFRGTLVRRERVLMQYAAIIIQRNWRCHVKEMSYMRLRMACLTLQIAYFNMRLRNARRLRMQRIMRGIVAIQSIARKFLTRSKLEKQVQAAVKIQSMVRCYQARIAFLKKKRAAVKLQAIWRAHKLRYSYLISRGAAITVQAFIRGRQQRLRYLKLYRSTLVLQCRYRAIKLCRETRIKYVNIYSHVVFLQSCVRSWLVRHQLSVHQNSALKIQTWYRASKTRKYYTKLRTSALLIQSQFRAKHARKTFLQKKQSVCKLQLWYNSVKIQRHFIHKKASVIKIQRWYRMKKIRQNFIKLKQSSGVIKNWYKARKTRITYLKLRQSATTIQLWFRGLKVKQSFNNQRHAVLKIQHWIKSCLARKRYLIQLKSAYIIQNWYRSIQQCRKYKVLKKSSSFIQFWYRSCKIRQLFLEQRKSALVIQRWFRKKLLSIHTRNEAIVRIQSYVRRWQCLKNYSRKLSAIRKIQYSIMGWIAQRKYKQVLKSALLIQTYYRRWTCQRHYRRQVLSVVKCQSIVRRFLAHRYYERCVKSATKLQCFIRMCQAKTEYKKKKECFLLKKAAIKIQSYYRMYRQKKNYLHALSLVKFLQSYVRNWFHKRLKASIVIQTYYRNYRHRLLQLKLQDDQRLMCISLGIKHNLAAIQIQRWYRKHLQLCYAKQNIHQVLLLQRWFRSCLYRLHFLRLQKSVCIIQDHIRKRFTTRRNAAICIQSHVRRWLAKKCSVLKIQAIIKCQALLRGKYVRTKLCSRRLTQTRIRLISATNASTEEQKLYRRTQFALGFLLRPQQLSHVLNALKNLEVVTRLSPVCCEEIVAADSVNIIYCLVRGCNRSLPHMELIKYSISILLNLTKYEKTSEAVFRASESVETLLDLLQIYREKEVIFCQTCTLLGLLLSQRTHRRDYAMGVPKFHNKLKSLYKLTMRKFKLKEKQLEEKARKEISRSFSLNQGHLDFSYYRHPILPKIIPSWNLRRDSITQIDDPMAAINFLLNSVDLTPT